jgi:hypothetical protein
MEKKTLLFNLSKELQYSKKGNFETTAQLEIDAPCFMNLKQSNVLAQCFARALFASRQHMQDGDVDQADQNAELGANEVKLLLLGSSEDFSTVVDAFTDLCCVSCTLDHERSVYLLRDHFKKMEYNDILNCIFEYIAAFTAPSVLAGLNAEG